MLTTNLILLSSRGFCDLISAAHDWKDEVKAVKLPTLLEGEALAPWLEEDDRKCSSRR